MYGALCISDIPVRTKSTIIPGYITFDDQTTTKNEQITKMEQRDERRTGVLYVRRYATNTSDHRTDPELLLRAISLLLPYEYEVSDI
jgi:hypothetical protein